MSISVELFPSVENLLQFRGMARIESGKVELDESYALVSGVLEKVSGVFEMEAKKKEILYTHEVQVEHQHIMCDVTKVQEIFVNLISNAVKFYREVQISAQLKSVVDRFCAYNSSLHAKHMKSALLTVAWNADDWTFEALEAHYKTLVRYCGFKDQGMILGYGCGSPEMTKRSKYVKDAYLLGKKLK